MIVYVSSGKIRSSRERCLDLAGSQAMFRVLTVEPRGHANALRSCWDPQLAQSNQPRVVQTSRNSVFILLDIIGIVQSFAYYGSVPRVVGWKEFKAD